MTSEPITLNLKTVNLSDDQFYQLCQINENWRLEETAQEELLIMPPVGGITGNRESDLNANVVIWNRQTQLGKVFSSSTIFILPQGGKRSPDAAWVENSRWDALTREQQEKFVPLCPDFVIELRSRTDPLKQLQDKMQEYLNSGLKLGWLINPQTQQVEIYRPTEPVETVELPTRLSGENILPGFTLDLPLF
ncbi:Uma2 family endonuclease [Oscillatoria sp. HE19RPO]|uniref:Uma2 family endonuclease n=1 Tax=Oscillatoria sp. HE19RPO TaxID=2954806 RepID=UPI0020C31BFE|nr:Uma2 family endonuclease [Oscillatoria sp. HE19RPO]